MYIHGPQNSGKNFRSPRNPTLAPRVPHQGRFVARTTATMWPVRWERDEPRPYRAAMSPRYGGAIVTHREVVGGHREDYYYSSPPGLR